MKEKATQRNSSSTVRTRNEREREKKSVRPPGQVPYAIGTTLRHCSRSRIRYVRVCFSKLLSNSQGSEQPLRHRCPETNNTWKCDPPVPLSPQRGIAPSLTCSTLPSLWTVPQRWPQRPSRPAPRPDLPDRWSPADNVSLYLFAKR